MKTCKCNSHNTSTLYATINHVFFRSFRGAEAIEMCCVCVCVRYLKIFSSLAFISTLTPFKSAVKLFCSKNTSSLALNANASVNGVSVCVVSLLHCRIPHQYSCFNNHSPSPCLLATINVSTIHRTLSNNLPNEMFLMFL